MPVSLDKFFGIILYDIELDGRLNGVYTNIPVAGEIFNEICRKTIATQNGDDRIVGNYKSQWFEGGNAEHQGVLVVSPLRSNAYNFRWTDNNGSEFVGVGYKMNERQIAVSYWQTK